MPLRCAIAWRRKLSTETPGISSGCWKPRNSPSAARSSIGRSVMSVPPEEDPAAGDGVGRVAEQRVGEGRLPGAVGPHQGVQLARLHGQVHARAGSPGRRRLRGGRRSRAQAGARACRAAGGSRPRRHSNNTTAVVEIKPGRIGGNVVRAAAPRGRRPRSRGPWPRPRSAPRPPAAGGRIEGADPADRLHEVVLAVAAKAGHAVFDDLGRGAPVGGDHRVSARHRLGHHEAERLGPADREHHRARPAEQLDLLVVRHVLVELHVGAEHRLDLVLEVLAFGRLAALQEHEQRQAGAPRDPDRLGRSLVGVGASDVHERASLSARNL